MSEDRNSPDPRYGPWKFIHEIGTEDLRAHPIWLWCMSLGLADEEDGPIGGDETSMRPVLNSTNVEPEMSQPLILLRVKGTDYFARGLYDPGQRKLEAVIIEITDETTTLTRVGGLRVPRDWRAPLTFIAVPTIDGKAEAEFCCESLDKDEARILP
jgi:hypothetical protein